MFSKLNPTTVVVAGLAAFAICVAALLALYALSPAKPDVAPLFAGIPGGVAALVSIAVARVQRSHSTQLATIGRNTNGVLTERINDAVSTSVPIAVATALAAANVVAVVPKQPTPTDVADATPAVPVVSTGA